MSQLVHSQLDSEAQTANLPSPFRASNYSNDGKRHLLLAASGSVATIKIPNILQALSHHPNLSIRLILTKSAANFLGGQSSEQPHLSSLLEINNVEAIYLDEDEWLRPWRRGDAILHIELRRWAHILVIAPLSANTLAKITAGFSDNLLTSVVRAWDTMGLLGDMSDALPPGKKRIVVAAAMNTAMWRHPVTNRSIRLLEEDWGVGADGENGESTGEGWFEVLRPQEKELAFGDVGDGAMRDWKEIVKTIEKRLKLGSG